MEATVEVYNFLVDILTTVNEIVDHADLHNVEQRLVNATPTEREFMVDGLGFILDRLPSEYFDNNRIDKVLLSILKIISVEVEVSALIEEMKRPEVIQMINNSVKLQQYLSVLSCMRC